MGKRCIYCSATINSDCVVDMCGGCMHRVWGPKMAAAIVESMEKEKEKGNMELGRVSETEAARGRSAPVNSRSNSNGFGEVSSSDLDLY